MIQLLINSTVSISKIKIHFTIKCNSFSFHIIIYFFKLPSFHFCSLLFMKPHLPSTNQSLFWSYNIYIHSCQLSVSRSLQQSNYICFPLILNPLKKSSPFFNEIINLSKFIKLKWTILEIYQQSYLANHKNHNPTLSK